MKQLKLAYIPKVNGQINLPGSKSISNRALLLAALSSGTTTLHNLLDSDDIRFMLKALSQLGVNYQLNDDKTICTVEGLGRGFDIAQPLSLYLGNAGTAMRPLCAALAASKGTFELTGEPRMEERPIKDLVDALAGLGCSIQYQKQQGFPPIFIDGKGLAGGQVSIAGNLSSQYLTALLMAAPLAKSDVTVKVVGELVSKPYIDITINLMAHFGVKVVNHNYQSFVIKSGQRYQSPDHFLVEGDASSASYFLAAGAIQGGSVTVKGIGKNSIQGDVAFTEVLAEMGASIECGDSYIRVSQSKLRAVDLDLNHIPDAAMTIATTALFAKGTTTIRNIYNWRIKETDRLSAMATELSKVGAKVIEGNDYIQITPPKELCHAQIETYNDHRMAMCFSLLAFAKTAITINDPDCTSKTFPDYFKVFNTLKS
ncbi:MAG: 3-phosphoshikimate 1-carboxyvinyltransferase [Parashewanella sp.]